MSLSIAAGAMAATGVAPAASAGEIHISSRAINSSLLVGEPLILSVTVQADVPVVVPTDLMSADLPFRVLVDRGSGFVPYVEYVLSPAPEYVGGGRVLEGVTREFLLGYDAATGDWTFPAPGTYRLMVEYREATGGPVESNTSTVTVQAPTGAEKEVHDALRRIGPELVVAHEPGPIEPWIESLIQDYPGSVYLQERRLRDLEGRIVDIGNGYEPGHVPETGTTDDPPPGPDNRPNTIIARAQDLLPLAMDLAAIPSSFQPEALLKLGELYHLAGQPERGLEVFQRLVDEFPDREAARIARAIVGDHTPPILEVIASPASPWPPNHRLEPVSVSVEVSDDQDPSPVVSLVSIVCDDACEPETDIVDAAYGTDDRQFRLRSERRGASAAGRAYTITYSATDASGNTATATTTVIVAHDRGRR